MHSKDIKLKQQKVEITIIEGITKENRDLICAYAGSNLTVQYNWVMQIFKESSRKSIGKIKINGIRETLDKHYPECALLLVDDHEKELQVLRDLKKAFVLPYFAQSYIDLSKPISKFPIKSRRYLANTKSKLIKKYNLTFSFSESENAQKDFYFNFYQPYIANRFKRAGSISRFEDVFPYQVPFKILQIKFDDNVISAGVIHFNNNCATLSYVGIKDGKLEYIKQGGLSALYYFLICELIKEGYNKLYLGGSSPFLTNGLTWHKIRLSAKHNYDYNYDHMRFTAFYILRYSLAVQELITKSPFVIKDINGEINGALFLKHDQFDSEKDFIKFYQLLQKFALRKYYFFELDDDPIPIEWYRSISFDNIEIVESSKTRERIFQNRIIKMKSTGIQVVELKKHQFEKWDEFVDQSPQGDVFSYSWWLDAITKSNFKIIAILNCNEIQAGIALAFDANNKVNEPPLTRTLGPLYSRVDNASYHREQLLHRKWLNLLLERIDLDEVVQFCTHQNFDDWLPFRWKGYKQNTRYTYIITYKQKSEESLWKNLNRSHKREINKAKSNNLRVEVSNDFDLFYELICMTYKRQGLKFVLSHEDFHRLDKEIIKRDKRRIFITYDESNQPHAGVYVVFNKKSAYSLLSGSDPQLKHLCGNTLAMWEAIKYFRTVTDIYNFGGSDIQRIEKYLRGFGGDFRQYFHIYKEQPVIKEIIKEVIKEIPVPKTTPPKVVVEEVIKEIPAPNPTPHNDWGYHFAHFMNHAYCLYAILRDKIFFFKK